MLHVVGEHTRESPAIVVERTSDAEQVVTTLERLAGRLGAPRFIRMDNGPD